MHGPRLATALTARLPGRIPQIPDFKDLKTRVRTAQLKAALSVNREMIRLYWDIGRLIVERQQSKCACDAERPCL